MIIWTTLIRLVLRSQVDSSGNKKSKKALKTSAYALDSSDELAKAKRARRFEREHEIERQRARGGGIGFRVDPEPSYNPYTSAVSITQSLQDISMEPGYDPVSFIRGGTRLLTNCGHRTSLIGIAIP